MLNEKQQKLYDELQALLAYPNSPFHKNVYVVDGRTYEVYDYRLASYMDFERPSGRECRGHTFEVKDGQAIELVALPMEKCHNLGECPQTINLDLSQIESIEDKADGSLISTYLRNDQLFVKSKGSLNSEQAQAAQAFLNRDENKKLRARLGLVTRLGYTVNMEWCAPDNQIVVHYPEPKLVILNARDRGTFEYMKRTELFDWFEKDQIIRRVEATDMEAYINEVPHMLGNIEGYIVRLKSGLTFKIKTNKYVSLHRLADTVRYDRLLFQAAIHGETDDLRGLFREHPEFIVLIDKMEIEARSIVNEAETKINEFYEANKHLERKDFAILCSKQQPAVRKVQLMPFIMNRYLGRDYRLIEVLSGRWKDLNFKPEPT